MKLDDIVALAKAGYTAEQISQLASVGGAPAKQEEAAQPPAEHETLAEHETQAKPDPMEAMLSQLSQLTAAIQANGILGSTQPKKPTADDILASIIAPPRKE